jgi:hypothetical protein
MLVDVADHLTERRRKLRGNAPMKPRARCRSLRRKAEADPLGVLFLPLRACAKKSGSMACTLILIAQASGQCQGLLTGC